ncbi:hypothetical protein BDP55DRAFT_163295 [Colletotrichum godetiae]|uniref:Heterokaryon incompatibility domain-containing protein n=1 Tax=Colletotrichum godetiae TaxID=1209918 RepID=A0AAJ0EX37_9PEZI|nr:uncharacterized protein BDP55DRAFT_163295 [Colletotrichum godetiae]KAK1674860.1 hypothetical protein BDP55DRAFT_163295 [Colletotrichum godetiae]
MGSIYRWANHVRIWLGEASPDSAMAMELVNDCARIESPQHIIKRITREDSSAQALITLLRRPYWSRMWVFQEIVLSKRATVHCGAFQAEWSAFKRLDRLSAHTQDWAKLQGRETWVLELRKALFGIAQFCITKKQARLVTNILQPTRRLQSKDPRDKIFALLGVCDRDSFLSPDYTMSTRDLYIASTRNLIEQNQDLSILLTSGLWSPENGENIDLPSWVPDFRGASGIDIQYMAASYLNYFNAARGTHFSLPLQAKIFAPCHDILETEGILLNPVSKNVALGKGEAGRRNVLEEFAVQQTDAKVEQPTLEALFQAMIFENATFHGGTNTEERTRKRERLFRLALGFTHEAFMLRAEDSCGSALAITESIVGELCPLSEQSLIEEYLRLQREDPEQLYWLREEFKLRTEESTDSSLTTIFSTTDGYIGRSLTQIKRGDLVAILAGCRLPLILRVQEDSGCYFVVCPCYVGGVMFGELEKRFRSNSPDGLEIRKISLV